MGAPWFPVVPELTQRASASMDLRYEDVAQDGRATLIALPHAVGEVVWRNSLAEHEGNRALLRRGILPILSRMVIAAGEDPIPVTRPVTATGGYEITRSTERIFLDIYVDVFGKRGRTHQPGGDGAGVPVGRVYAEHVFTRPWGKPDERRVTSLDVDGFEPTRTREERAIQPSLPPGAALLDLAPVLDPVPITFGMMHTDSNQHVNSLVYIRLFEEALLRRHESGTALARWLEIAYRKPCFAGDRVRIELQAFTREGEIGAFGRFVSDAGKTIAFVTMGAR